MVRAEIVGRRHLSTAPQVVDAGVVDQSLGDGLDQLELAAVASLRQNVEGKDDGRHDAGYHGQQGVHDISNWDMNQYGMAKSQIAV